jgi:Ca2+-binding RTX toxin-like protein
MAHNKESFDWNTWWLGLPVNEKGHANGFFKTIKTNLADFTSDNFFKASDGAVVFRANVIGAKSLGTSSARSELGAIDPKTGKLTAWTVKDGATMSATLKIDEVPARDDGMASRIVIGQIHGYGSAQMVRLIYDNGQLLFLNSSPANNVSSNTPFYFYDASGNKPNISLHEKFSYRMDVREGKLTVEIFADGKTYSSVSDISPAFNDTKFYFKAGVYLSANESTADGFGQVSFYGIDTSNTSGKGNNAWKLGMESFDRTHDGENTGFSIPLTYSSEATSKNDVLVIKAGQTKLLGLAGSDTLHGLSGNDFIDGGDGNDTIYARAGNDIIYGGRGNDTINAGDGNDIVYGGEHADFITGGKGDDIIYGDDGYDVLHGNDGNDTVYGGRGQDDLFGGKGDDFLSGNDGVDHLYGGFGKDILNGDNGDDYLKGDADDDTLSGGKGNDVLIGGTGADILYGNAGLDTFVFESLDDKGDIIMDFSKDEKIDLSKVVDFFINAENKTIDQLICETFISFEKTSDNKVTNLVIDIDGQAGKESSFVLATIKTATANMNFNSDHIIIAD